MPEARDIEIVCVDEDAFGYATFQSHNQKVVSNRNGVFVSDLTAPGASAPVYFFRFRAG